MDAFIVVSSMPDLYVTSLDPRCDDRSPSGPNKSAAYQLRGPGKIQSSGYCFIAPKKKQ